MIIFLGDSWGVGAGPDLSNEYVIGPGVAQLLGLDNIAIINISLCGGSNSLAVNRLQLLLEKFQPSVTDEFYWIITDPTRCIPPEQFVESCDTLTSKTQYLLHTALSAANDIAEMRKIKINLIGGLCDLTDKLVDNYPNLILKVPSWAALLGKDYRPSIFSNDGSWHKIIELIPNQRLDLKEETIHIMGSIISKRKFINNNKNYFSIDMSHPNGSAHIVLKNHLWPKPRLPESFRV